MEVEISAGKKPIQKPRLLFAFFGYLPRKFTMAYSRTVLTAILDPLGEYMLVADIGNQRRDPHGGRSS
jgi:hypothetical protein